MIVRQVTSLFQLIRSSFVEFGKNDPLRLAGATAFFTTFALPPILVIVLQLFAVVFRVDNLSDKFFERLAAILGKASTDQIKVTFLGFKSLASNRYITVGGVIFLAFVATTLFKVIKETLDQLWNIRPDSKIPFTAKLGKRALSMLIIILAGILFMTNTLAEGMQALLGRYLNELYAGSGSAVESIVNPLISVAVVAIWFAVLFKLLPDARPSWKVVIWGSIFTAVLFTIGKIVIRFMLSFGNLGTVFGASTSIVIFLLFVFYSSFIFYFGACFTKVYAEFINDPIEPGEHAYKYELREIKRRG